MPLLRGFGYNNAYFRSLPFDQQLARISLSKINAGPDGVESMGKCRYNTDVYQLQGQKSFFDPFAPVKRKPVASELKPSRLLSLPEKVRTTIYAYAVTYPDPIPIRLNTATTSPSSTSSTGGANAILQYTWFFLPSLLRTCRALKRDAAALFYANNVFRFETTDGDIEVLLTWLQTRKTVHMQLIPKLIITLEPRSYFDLETLRRTEGTVGRRYDYQALGKLLVFCGFGVDKVLMEDRLSSPELARDASMLGRGTRDTGELVGAWFRGVREFMEVEEWSFEKAQEVRGVANAVDAPSDLSDGEGTPGRCADEGRGQVSQESEGGGEERSVGGGGENDYVDEDVGAVTEMMEKLLG